jgi:hypothetical protein
MTQQGALHMAAYAATSTGVKHRVWPWYPPTSHWCKGGLFDKGRLPQMVGGCHALGGAACKHTPVNQ